MDRGTSRIKSPRALVVICVLAVCAAIVGPGPVFSQTTLMEDVRKALDRIGSDAFSAQDEALLFANNDAVNAARINNEIPEGSYLAAQGLYDRRNQAFAKAAADEAGAGFTVQERTSDTFSPGTDSDYITEVTSKDQIGRMQEGYNKRVNDYLKESLRDSAPQASSTWHNKLDVDFMADPDVITDPQEFREIAAMNNDAYKSRFAAQYERISRAKDGSKIGPEHVTGYMDEMNAFAGKKSRKIEELLAKGPAHFSDPANRAELFRAMAQEQKYVSRLESLDDFLRAQEGLPPRNRGVTSAKLGSNRAPGNAANIRSGHALADAARMDALEDLAETMGQVAKKNPSFNANAADDIAKIVESLPPERRAGVLTRLRANGSPGLVEDIVDASRRAGRMPPGSSLADDVARAGSKFDEAADIANKLDDLADAGMGRRGLRAAITALEAIGKAADAVEVGVAAGQLMALFGKMDTALDPDTPPEQVSLLLEEIRRTANELRDSAALGAITQRYPLVAAVYGAWTVGCITTELATADSGIDPALLGESQNDSCLDRHTQALWRLSDELSGRAAVADANRAATCARLISAIKDGRLQMKEDWTVREACQWIRYGNPIDHMVERVPDRDVSSSPEDEDAVSSLTGQVEALLGEIESNVGLAENAIAGQNNACARLADLSSVGEGLDLETIQATIIAPSVEKARQTLSTIREGVRSAEILISAVQRSETRADEERARACGTANRQGERDTAMDAAVKARNHAVLAAQVGKRATSLGEAAIAAAKQTLPVPESLNEQILSKMTAVHKASRSACEQVSAIPETVFLTSEAIDALAKARSELAQLDAILNLEVLAAVAPDYRGRQAALAGRVNTAALHPMDAGCVAKFLGLKSACVRLPLVPALPPATQQALMEYQEAYAAVREQQQAAAIGLRQKLDKLPRVIDWAADHAEKARVCLEAITGPEEAEQAAKQEELTSLTGLLCSRSSISRRVEKLDAGVADSPEIDRFRERLLRMRNTIVDAETVLARSDAMVDTLKASQPEDLPRARFKVINIRRDVSGAIGALKAIPNPIDCGFLMDQLTQADRELGGLLDELQKKPETRQEAVNRCRRKYDDAFLKVKKTSSGGFSCQYCKTGYRPHASGQSCILTQEAANQRCEKANKGRGYYAVNFKADGSFSCRPTQATANRWCNANNRGSGWRAVNITDTGKFQCRQKVSQKDRRRQAEKACRAEAQRRGKVYALTQFNKDGSYRCRWCEPGFYYANGNCHARQQVRQKTPQRQQNGSGPLYLCTSCGAGSILGCTAGTPRRQHYSKWAIPGEDCRRVR